MSKKQECTSLLIKIPKDIMKDFNTEIVHKYGRTYGNMPNAVIEAIICWVEVQKRERKKSE